MEENHIYQYSLLNALMDGVCESGITAAQLAERGGTQGIGTFARMDGELVFLDGTVWQLQAGGRARAAAPDARIPFAVSTRFAAQRTRDVALRDKGDLDAALADAVGGGGGGGGGGGAANLFVTYRLDGRFEALRCRTVRGQEYAGQPLAELGAKQSVETYEDVAGSIVGFRTPRNWQGFGVAGEHLHFINEARTAGGHVLEVKAARVRMRVAVANNVHVELPTGEDFNAATLVTDDAGVKAVEG